MLLTVCKVPQRASRRSDSTDRLSSVGLSNSLLVGRITNSVNGMTLPSTAPATSHPECRPGEPRCNGGHQSHRCQSRLHDSGSTIARREFGDGYFRPALHPCRMFDEIDVDGGSREQGARKHRNEFGKLAHQSTLSAQNIEHGRHQSVFTLRA
jgi:hypothetical protein